MIVINCEQATYFDIDDTLVKWTNVTKKEKKQGIPIKCPINASSDDYTWIDTLVPHKKHIERLKLHKARGHTIIVWSAGGSEWAEVVIRTLGLNNFVDVIIEKPMRYYDDLNCKEFMGDQRYLKDE